MSRVALVTGASRGLGECIARRLHGAGYRVALADVRLDGVQQLAAELDGSGATAVAIELDVRSKADFQRARDLLAERWGRHRYSGEQRWRIESRGADGHHPG